MTDGTKIRKSAFVPGRWPNAAGISWTIANAPAGSAPPHCQWQFSTALIERSVPFSFLPGIDRVLTLLEGPGFHLSVAGQKDLLIERPFVPTSFPGDAATDCTVKSGPSRVLNLLFSRVALRADVSVIGDRQKRSLSADGDVALLFALEGSASVGMETQTIELDEGDAACLEGAGDWTVQVTRGAAGARVFAAILSPIA
ncbi:HutD family protein [Hyphomicrobium sp. LHD-15]|uniref:HutD/Ves family protein n=1 Tax=Hyphomicrobium sp. LHD-15 TaxID=3072142 RepID=UPI0035BE326C